MSPEALMLFALLCEDRSDAGSLRAETRAEHLAHLEALGSRLRFAGPFLDENGTPVGSLLVVDAESLAAAEALAAEDPYARAGLFRSVAVRRWNWTVNNPDAA